MNRDLLALQPEPSAYPIKLKQAETLARDAVAVSEHEVTEDRGIKNRDRFKRYKKGLQKRARSIF